MEVYSDLSVPSLQVRDPVQVIASLCSSASSYSSARVTLGFLCCLRTGSDTCKVSDRA